MEVSRLDSCLAPVRTEHERAPATLERDAQRTEALERIARGTAHDFSNLLFTVLGCTASLLEQLPPDSSLRELADDAHSAATSARVIVRRLQAYAGQLILQPTPHALGELVSSMQAHLAVAAGPLVTVDVSRGPGPTILVDAEQLGLVLDELVANARDAMPDGGTITIDVGSSSAHARIVVTDEGVGMDEATAARVFEPYFTTRSRERRKGLGLAMVHGIVTRSQGRVSVRSAPGEGAAFELLLPL